jgi:hypothetical protein
MITELVLLLGLFAFILGGAFFGSSGPRAVFEKSGPRLGARIEQNLSTGRAFNVKDGTPAGLRYFKPPGAAPEGSFQ